MVTIGEEIEQFKNEYENGDTIHKYLARQIAAAEHFKACKIWEYIQSQPNITKEDAFGKE